jgi:hypothetical protein
MSQDVFKHEVDSKPDYVDHFGVNVVADYRGISSEVPMYEGKLFARL